jgi:(2Fe-2S) ferredoxin
MTLVILYDDLTWNTVDVEDYDEAVDYILKEGDSVFDYYVKGDED